jgi:putative hydrolase
VDNPVDDVWTARGSLWSASGAPVDKLVGDTPGAVAATLLTSDNGGAHDVEKEFTGGSDEDRVTSQHAGAGGPDPVAVLRRIAFLLERRLADSYRIKAYRGAAAALLAVGTEEVRQRAVAGTLRDLPGVGAKTAALVAECVAGDVPAYLSELERTAGPLADGGAELRSALRGDLHSHSDWSDGGSPIEEMAMTAVEVGHEYLVLTDHSPRLRVANGLSVERLTRQLDIVDAVSGQLTPFRLLRGIEVDILEDGGLDQTEEMLGRLDVVVASVHSKLRMDRSAMTRRMLAAVRHPRTNVLGHCTGRLVTGGRGTRPQSEFDAEAVFAACAEHDVAVEINSRPERRDPPDELVAVALEAGCLFSVDSDAHAPGQLDFVAYGAERAAELGVPPERIVTTWPVDRLLAWAAG